MSVTTEEPKPFDAAEFIKAKNAGTPLPEAKVEEKAEESKPVVQEEDQPRLPRSVRHQMNKLQREIGAERARREMLESQIAQMGAAKPKVDEDPEPKRESYATEGEYIKEVTRWGVRQELKANQSKVEESKGSEAQNESFRQQVEAATEKFKEDLKLIPDWDEVAKKAAADEDAPEYVPSEHPGLMTLIATSDVQAFVLVWLAKHPNDMQRLLDLSPKPADQIQLFRRLEGKAETAYDKPQAAQASTEKPKDRITPEKAEQARGTAVKPKPSSEVTASGGSSAPSEPAIGSKAWMEARNQAQYTTRY